MKKSGMFWMIAAGFALVLTIFSMVAAQGGYMLTWYTADGGGGLSTGGSYQLISTSGQPDADILIGRGYSLAGGFWVDPALYLSPTSTPTATATPTAISTTTSTNTPTATATEQDSTVTPNATNDNTTPMATETLAPSPTLTPDPSLIYQLYLPIHLR